MKLKDIYRVVIEKGIEADPRTRKEIKKEIASMRSSYNKLDAVSKKCFDRDRLKHPFDDTRILNGAPDKEVRTIMVGIDITAGELLAAHLLNEKGAAIDLVVSHHPAGRALANLTRVMGVQADILKKMGIKSEIADRIMKERMDEVSRGVASRNHEQVVDIARLLNIAFMCVHTPADNHVTAFLNALFAKKKPKKVKNVLDLLRSVPEYEDGIKKGSGPTLLSGKETGPAGKIFVDMTGGTEGSKKVYPRLSQAGVETVVGMHISENHFKLAKAEFLNVIIAGHIASDTLGLNLVLDELEKKERLNIIPCGGFTRVKR